jgi:hypothetical protein
VADTLSNSIGLAIPVDALRPLVEAVVREAVERLGAGAGGDAGALLFTEEVAAARLSMTTDQLRCQRRAGRITFCRAGRQIRYSKYDLERYVADCSRRE